MWNIDEDMRQDFYPTEFCLPQIGKKHSAWFIWPHFQKKKQQNIEIYEVLTMKFDEDIATTLNRKRLFSDHILNRRRLRLLPLLLKRCLFLAAVAPADMQHIA